MPLAPKQSSRKETLICKLIIVACATLQTAAPGYSQAKNSVQDFEITDTTRLLNDAFSKVENALRVPIDFEEAPVLDPPKTGPVPMLSVHFVDGETNALAAVQTVLAAFESTADAERTVPSTIDLIVDKIARASDVTVKVLNQPYLLGERIRLGAKDEPAMHVLERLSDSVSPVSFRFVYEPFQRVYYLNVKGVSTFRPDDTSKLFRPPGI